MPYTSPASVTAGTVATAAWGNSIKAGLDFQANPPSCRLTQSGNLACADNAQTDMTWNGETWDTDSMHSTSSLTDRITFNTAGLYVITFNFRMAGEATLAWVQGQIVHNGTVILGTANVDRNGASFQPTGSLTVQFKAVATDWVKARIYQDNTNNVAVNFLGNDANGASSFSATWVGLG